MRAAACRARSPGRAEAVGRFQLWDITPSSSTSLRTNVDVRKGFFESKAHFKKREETGGVLPVLGVKPAGATTPAAAAWLKKSLIHSGKQIQQITEEGG